jgi:hypothetical protein
MVDPEPSGGTRVATYYDPGVGTEGGVDRYAGGMFGMGLSANVLEAYRFLSMNYRDGDNIYIFGFSRGAFTARSLCGFLSASGLLRANYCDVQNQDRAWSHYRTKPKKRFPAEKARLAEMTHRDVRVRFLGVFDTVGALGVPRTWLNWPGRQSSAFHDTEVSSIVDHACHALAIDEERTEFEAAVWRQPRYRGYKTVEQVWFPGGHSNIGGGFEDRGLSDLTLDWMVRRLAKHCPELSLHLAALNPSHRATIYSPRSWMFLPSNWRPLLRVINRCVPKDLRGRRVATLPPHCPAIGEMLHWSAVERYMETRKLGAGRRYAPVNLRAALDSARAGNTRIVGRDGEPVAHLQRSTRDGAAGSIGLH